MTDPVDEEVVVTPDPEDQGNDQGSSGGTIKDHLGFCESNDDCKLSTFCCSDFSCTDPSICLHGGKQHRDVCTFGFECMSRCCVDDMCSHFLNCYQTCESNANCTDESTPCCSQGYCTDSIVC